MSQNAVRLSRYRVGLFKVTEGEKVVGAATRLAGRLSKPLVKLTMLRPGNVRNEPVEDPAALFVVVYSIVE
jgi:hypothetical protein